MSKFIKTLIISTVLMAPGASHAFAPLLAAPALWTWITGTGAFVAHSSGGIILTTTGGYAAGTLIPAAVVTAAPLTATAATTAVVTTVVVTK